MEVDELLDAFKRGDMSQEEREILLSKLSGAMEEVKERDPKQYLRYLKTINERMEALIHKLQEVNNT